MFQFGYEQRGLRSAGLLALDGLANPVPASSLADAMTIVLYSDLAFLTKAIPRSP